MLSWPTQDDTAERIEGLVFSRHKKSGASVMPAPDSSNALVFLLLLRLEQLNAQVAQRGGFDGTSRGLAIVNRPLMENFAG